MKIISFTAILMSLLVFTGGMSELAAAAGAKKVLVFVNQRNNNDLLVSSVVEMLKKEGCAVKLESGKKLHGNSVSRYGAIVLFNFLVKNEENKSVKVYADENVQKKIVLFNAVGSDYLEPDRSSGETKEIKTKKLTEKIVENVREVLSRQ